MTKVITHAVLDMETLQWLPELEESYAYDGPWEQAMGLGGIFQGLFGGASKQEEQQAKQDNEFTQALRQQQATIFGQNEAAQTALNAAWDPILKGGAYQYGFSTAEDADLQNSIRQEGAQQTTNTINAAELRQQQATGGASSGPSGGAAALEAMAAQTEAQNTGSQLAQEKLAGYERGGQLFGEATNVKQGVLAANNPEAAAGQASQAADVTNTANKTVDTANANSLTAKLIGGAAQGAMSLGLGQFGNMMGLGSPAPVSGAPLSVPGYASGIGGTMASAFPPSLPSR